MKPWEHRILFFVFLKKFLDSKKKRKIEKFCVFCFYLCVYDPNSTITVYSGGYRGLDPHIFAADMGNLKLRNLLRN